MISQEEARARVAKGASYLDQVKPGWFTRIDVGTLTLHDPCGCVIGQLCGEYFIGLAMLDFTRDEGVACGFEVRLRKSDRVAHGGDYAKKAAMIRANHQPLQDAWIEAIADRLLSQASNGAAAATSIEVTP